MVLIMRVASGVERAAGTPMPMRASATAPVQVAKAPTAASLAESAQSTVAAATGQPPA